MNTDYEPMPEIRQTSTQLARIETNESAPNIGQMVKTVIDKGITSDNAGALDKLLSVYERMADRDAERAFAVAFKALQAEMKAVKATKSVPDRNGNTKFMFAPYDEIMEQVAPLLDKHGFTVCFSQDVKDSRIVRTCNLQHVGGHSRANHYTTRIGSGPPNASEAQADGAASTYAKRFALCDALNIKIEGVDNDARNEGASISKNHAEELRTRITNIHGDEAAFLKLAGAKSFEEISSVKVEMLEEMLAKKERIYMQKLGAK